MAWKDADATIPNVSRLAKLIGTHAPYDGIFELRVPGVSVIRLSRTNDESIHGLAKSAVCIVAQGAKTVMVGEDVYEYEAGQVAVYSVDLPMMDAGSASRRVGYVSASQFSREYGRFFGTAPTKDIHRLRGEGLAAASDAPA